VEPAEEAIPRRRPRRAIAIIAASLSVILIASVVYLHQKIELPRNPMAALPTPTPTPPLLPDRYVADFTFLTPTLGWSLVYEIGRQFWIFRTTDEGRTWEQQLTGSVDLVDRFQVYERRVPIQFFDRMRGHVHVAPNTAFATEDGGRTWSKMNLPRYAIESLSFSDPLNGWILGTTPSIDNPVFHLEYTADGGNTWSALPAPPRSTKRFGLLFTGITFRSRIEGWARGTDDAQPSVFSSNDGGVTWREHVFSEMPTPNQGKPAYPGDRGVTLFPGGGVLTVVSGGAFVSFDQGETWRQVVAPGGTSSYPNLAFEDATHWWAMQFDGNLHKSSDAGRTWKRVSFQLDGFVYTIGVTDAQHAWARLESRVPPRRGFGLALSSDGGVHWTYAKVPTPT
jgi:photosystem II stability/assembly factor-like uncharacterized protein